MEHNKLSTTLSAKLVSSLGSVKSIINTAQTTPDLLIRRSLILEALSNSVRGVDSFNSVCRRTPETRHVRKQMKHLHNSLMSLSAAVENDEVDADELIDEINDELAVRVSAIEALANVDPNLTSLEDDELDDLLSESARGEKEVELSQLDKHMGPTEVNVDALKGAVKKLNQYDKHRGKLLRKLPSAGSIVPVEVPVVITFHSAALRQTKALQSVFPGKVEVVGVMGANSADIGTVLAGQQVLQFYKESALNFAEEKMDGDETAQRLKNARTVVNNLKKRERVLKKEQEALDAEENLAKRKKMLNKISAARIAKRRVEIEAQLTALEDKIALNAERVREAASVKRAKVKVNMRPEVAYFNRVNYFLEELAKRNQRYTLLSNAFVVSPSNPDILLAWIVPTEKFRLLDRLSGSNTKVLSWGLPWSKQVSDRAGVIIPRTVDEANLPDSMYLHTRVRGK